MWILGFEKKMARTKINKIKRSRTNQENNEEHHLWMLESWISSASQLAGVLLLFEGGTWRWPSIRRGYAREVLPGLVLKTVAVKPALFDLEFTSSSQGAKWWKTGWNKMVFKVFVCVCMCFCKRSLLGSNRYTNVVLYRSSGSSPGIPKLLTDVVKTSETNLFRSITEGKVSDTRTSDQAWLSYSSTQELRDLHNFTVQARSIGIMARPVVRFCLTLAPMRF